MDDDRGSRYRLRGEALERAWGEFIGRVPWEVTFTLTFAQRNFPVSARRASEETHRWLNYAGYLCRAPVVWAYAVERGRGGQWHSHALCVDAHESRWRLMAQTWPAQNGYARYRRVSEVRGASMYTSKSAAVGGEVVLSDTIGMYRDELAARVTVQLAGEKD